MANKNVKQKNPRTSAILSLVVILVVVALAGYVALFGIGKGTMINYVKPWGEAISLGLDLRGGVYTVYQAEDDGSADFQTKMDSTVSILTSSTQNQIKHRRYGDAVGKIHELGLYNIFKYTLLHNTHYILITANIRFFSKTNKITPLRLRHKKNEAA